MRHIRDTITYIKYHSSAFERAALALLVYLYVWGVILAVTSNAPLWIKLASLFPPIGAYIGFWKGIGRPFMVAYIL